MTKAMKAAPRGPTPAKRTNSDRARDSVRQREAEGWRSLNFFAPPTVSADLETIAARTGERKVDILARLLDADAMCLGIKGGPRG